MNRTAEDRAAALLREPEELYAEIVKRLEGDRARGDFAGVHICPPSTSDVPDDPSVRLVILRPEQTHKKRKDDTEGRKAADEFLNNRGNSPRINRNCLVFIAPDQRSSKPAGLRPVPCLVVHLARQGASISTNSSWRRPSRKRTTPIVLSVSAFGRPGFMPWSQFKPILQRR